MAEPYQIRSDFADEIISADIQSKTYEHIEKKNDYIRSNYIKVLCDENELGKHKGDYVSIECRDLDDHVVRRLTCASTLPTSNASGRSTGSTRGSSACWTRACLPAPTR